MQPPHDLPKPAQPDGQLTELRSVSGSELSAAAERSLGSIDQRRQQHEVSRIDRDDRMEGHLHTVLVVGLWVLAGAILGVILALLWNMAAPHTWRFLDPAEVNGLQAFLFSGAIGSALTAAGGKVIGSRSADEKPED